MAAVKAFLRKAIRSHASTRVGRRYKLDLTAMLYKPIEHVPSVQVEGRSGEISGLEQREVSKTARLRSSKYLNNVIEQDHRNLISLLLPTAGYPESP